MKRIKARTFSGVVCEQEVFYISDGADVKKADPGEKCDCGGSAAGRRSQTEAKQESEHISDKDVSGGDEADNNASVKVFMIRAVRCRRCNGILTSDFGIKNGIGQCCRQKELAQTPDKNQITLF